MIFSGTGVGKDGALLSARSLQADKCFWLLPADREMWRKGRDVPGQEITLQMQLCSKGGSETIRARSFCFQEENLDFKDEIAEMRKAEGFGCNACRGCVDGRFLAAQKGAFKVQKYISVQLGESTGGSGWGRGPAESNRGCFPLCCWSRAFHSPSKQAGLHQSTATLRQQFLL